MEHLIVLPPPDRQSLDDLLKQMHSTRAEIAKVFNRIDQLGPDKVILSPAGQPHALDGQAIHVDALGEPAVKSHAWLTVPIKDARGEDCLILVAPQLISEKIYYIADFFPWIYDRSKGTIVMKNKFTDQEVKSEAGLVEAECRAIAGIVSKYIAVEVADAADYTVTPHVIGQVRDPKTNETTIEQRELIKGPYPLWPEEDFVASRITFYKTSREETRSIALSLCPGTHKEIIVLKGHISVEVNGFKKQLEANTSAIISATAGSNKYYIYSDGEAEVIILHKTITQKQREWPNFNATTNGIGSRIFDFATRTRSLIPPLMAQTPVRAGSTHRQGAYVTRKYETQRQKEEVTYTTTDPQLIMRLLQILGQMA